MSGMITRLRALSSLSSETLKVINDVATKQFVIQSEKLQGEPAVISYELSGKTITLTNTNVPPEFQGKGIGKVLAKYALDHAQKNNLDVVCQCHFLAAYYNKNIDKYKNLKIRMELEDEENKS